MTNETMENDTPTNEEETETPTSSEGENPEKSTEADKPETSKELQTALAQKEHFREKYEATQRELEKFKQAEPAPAPTSSQNPMEFVKLAKALEGYSDEEVEFITRNAPNKSIDGIIAATKDDWVSAAIQAKREKVDKEKSTPKPSTKQGSGGSTSVLRDFKEGKLSEDQKEKFLQDIGVLKKYGAPPRPTR